MRDRKNERRRGVHITYVMKVSPLQVKPAQPLKQMRRSSEWSFSTRHITNIYQFNMLVGSAYNSYRQQKRRWQKMNNTLSYIKQSLCFIWYLNELILAKINLFYLSTRNTATFCIFAVSFKVPSTVCRQWNILKFKLDSEVNDDRLHKLVMVWNVHWQARGSKLYRDATNLLHWNVLTFVSCEIITTNLKHQGPIY